MIAIYIGCRCAGAAPSSSVAGRMTRRCSSQFGGWPTTGLEAWQEVLERGWEGLVAKDPQLPYVGGRTLK